MSENAEMSQINAIEIAWQQDGCAAGCQSFMGRETRHHPDCVFYMAHTIASLEGQLAAATAEVGRLKTDCEAHERLYITKSNQIWSLSRIIWQQRSIAKRKAKVAKCREADRAFRLARNAALEEAVEVVADLDPLLCSLDWECNETIAHGVRDDCIAAIRKLKNAKSPL